MRAGGRGDGAGRPLDDGERLTDEEYDRRVVALCSGQPETPEGDDSPAKRRSVLASDHRLGRAFVKRLFGLSLAPEARGLAGYVIDAYATVLNHDELVAFFAEDDVRTPALPLDPSNK